MTPRTAATDTETETETDETSSTGDAFDQAFHSAKEEHSSKEEQAPPAEASSQTDEEDDPEAAAAAATTADTKTATGNRSETGLISDAEFTALQAKHPDDPAALRKALEGAFTKKTQTLADERKSVERLQSYADIIDAYEADAPAAIRLLAKEHGIKLADEATTETAAADETTTATAVDAIIDEFKTGLGPELEYLADGLVGPITKLVERLTQSTVEKSVEPLKKQQEALVGKAAHEQTETVMKTLEQQHPDWKDHEAAMMALAQKIQPNGMSEIEYLDHLYQTVTNPARVKGAEKDIEKRIADGVKAALDKMKKGAEATETTTRSTPESQVRKAPPGVATFEEAAEAAKRGERWE